MAEEINYQKIGSGKTILYLHGWGRNHQDFLKTAQLLPGYCHVLVDLPGFGQSPIDKSGLQVVDYVGIIESFIKKNQLEVDLIVGHSFGGKIAFLYSYLNDCKIPLLLVAPSIVKPRFSFKKYLKIKKYKISKKLFKKRGINNAGSSDYQKSSGALRKTLVYAVNTYFDKLLLSYHGKVILYWGIKDQETPFYLAKRINKKIANCCLIKVDGDHFPHFEYKYHLARIIERELS